MSEYIDDTLQRGLERRSRLEAAIDFFLLNWRRLSVTVMSLLLLHLSIRVSKVSLRFVLLMKMFGNNVEILESCQRLPVAVGLKYSFVQPAGFPDCCLISARLPGLRIKNPTPRSLTACRGSLVSPDKVVQFHTPFERV